jgi:hypothetical protein
MAEADRDHRGLARHALAGAQVERHPAPAPVVDIELGGDEGFGDGIRLDVFFLLVARHGLAVDHAAGVLRAQRMRVHRALGDRADRAQHLHLFVAAARRPSSAAGGSIATTVSSCIRWFCSMSRSAPARS